MAPKETLNVCYFKLNFQFQFLNICDVTSFVSNWRKAKYNICSDSKVWQILASRTPSTADNLFGILNQRWIMEDGMLIIGKIFEEHVNAFLMSYILPFGILLNFINNIAVVLILQFGKQIAKHIPKSLCIYYTLLAIGDISTSFPLHITYFFGTIFVIITFFHIRLYFVLLTLIVKNWTGVGALNVILKR